MELEFRNIGGNDLSVDFECDCPEERYKDNEVLYKIMKTRIYLSGYNDDYFFREVNKYPRNFKCHNCGKEYRQQWFRDGIVNVYEERFIKRDGVKHESYREEGLSYG